MKRLEGKIALITGTGRGQGRAAALLFASEGAKIVGCDMNAEGSAETVAMVRAAGGEMEAWAPVDLSTEAGATEWVEKGVAAFGGIDILYNNASACRFGAIDTMSTEDWYFTTRNELDLVYLVTRAAWPHLVKRGGGSIINTSSTAAIRGVKGQSAHGAAKGGVTALTTGLVIEGGEHRIRVNSILPGPIRHPSFEEMMKEPDNIFTQMINRTPLGRLGEPEDIAPIALFLASDDSRWVTGAHIVADGGLSSWI